MIKKLKIRFVKFECAFAMQILEQKGDFSNSLHVKIAGSPEIDLGGSPIYLRGSLSGHDYDLCAKVFTDNDARDKQLKQIVDWISKEQFAMRGKIKIGSKCAVSDNTVSWRKRFLLAVLPEDIDKRYITNGRFPGESESWRYARPISGSDNLVIEDDVYTWQIEVSDER